MTADVPDAGLLPCPFCGGQAAIHLCGLEAVAECDCGAAVTSTLTPKAEHPDECWKRVVAAATAAWNRRAQPPAVPPVPDGGVGFDPAPSDGLSRASRSGSSRSLAALVRLVLENASKFDWSLQGMGMLRLHMADNTRLHIWDSRFRVPGVSMIHDHLQWGLHSTIVSGRLTNRRYRMVGNGVGGVPHEYTVLKPGYGCYHKTEPQSALLLALRPEVYGPGDSYSQKPDEIHETDALDGTVTVMCKTPTDDESARVFWPAGTTWGSAEPRRATPAEVAAIVGNALATKHEG